MKRFVMILAAAGLLVMSGEGVLRAENPCQSECEAALGRCLKDCERAVDPDELKKKSAEVKPGAAKKKCAKQCYATRRACWRSCAR